VSGKLRRIIMPSVIGSAVGGADAGVTVGANYLVVKQSPGAAYADKDGNVITSSPLLTFSTPNLQMFRVTITGEDLTATPTASDSGWSRVIRALQVTSEIFAVFPPEYDTITEGASTFCYLAPDFNTNAGSADVTGSVQSALTEQGGSFDIVEQAIEDAVGGNATVVRCMLVGAAIVNAV
jgi:hypothetical protein